MPNEPNLLDKITDIVVTAISSGQAKGAAGAALGFGLLTMTPALPEEVEAYSQMGCGAVVAAGIIKIIYHTVK